MNRGLLKQKALLKHWDRERLATQVPVVSMVTLCGELSADCEIEATYHQAACLIVVMEYFRDEYIGGPDDGHQEYDYSPYIVDPD